MLEKGTATTTEDASEDVDDSGSDVGHQDVQDTFDIYLTVGVKNNKAVGNCYTLFNIKADESLANVKQVIDKYDFPDNAKPDLDKGLYWMKKVGKDCMVLHNEQDWTKTKEVYTNKAGKVQNVRLAAEIRETRQKQLSDNEEPRPKKPKSLGDTFEYNKTQASVVKLLNKKGISDRYNQDHIRVWTEQIMAGKVTGPEEEPDWAKFLDEVRFYPRSDAPARRGQHFDLQQYMLLSDERQQRRDESFRNQMMMVMMGNKIPQYETQKAMENSSLSDWSCGKVSTYLRENNLGQYCQLFEREQVDGAVMSAITDEALKDIGVTNALDRCRIIGKFKKLQA